MKAIISGLRYDTDKAILVGQASAPHCYKGDFGYWAAGLYKAPRSGRFFLAGAGGPMTRFATHVKNGAVGDTKIIPLEDDDAREWAEHYLTHAEIEAAFANVITDA